MTIISLPEDSSLVSLLILAVILRRNDVGPSMMLSNSFGSNSTGSFPLRKSEKAVSTQM